MRILTARQTAAALAEVIDQRELPGFLGGTKPDAECLIPQALPVPAELGWELKEPNAKAVAAREAALRNAAAVDAD